MAGRNALLYEASFISLSATNVNSGFSEKQKAVKIESSRPGDGWKWITGAIGLASGRAFRGRKAHWWARPVAVYLAW